MDLRKKSTDSPSNLRTGVYVPSVECFRGPNSYSDKCESQPVIRTFTLSIIATHDPKLRNPSTVGDHEIRKVFLDRF